MSALAVVVLAGLVPMALIALLNLAFAPRLHALEPARSGPRVSVLIPARDEAANLRRLLPALSASRYADLEVIVLDDGSRDETRAVARGHATSDRRLRVIVGVEPPAGWTGKSWACQQLAREARGDLLIFCDADVVPAPDAVGRTVSALSRPGTDVVTALPRHVPGGWFQEAVIPMVAKLPIAALLPLPLVRHTRTPSLAIGNGQWLAWRRSAYGAVGGHARVRDEVLEDVALARAAKLDGLRLAPYVATRDIAVRMYGDRTGTWEGFGKNLYRLAGASDGAALPALGVFVALGSLPLVFPWLLDGPAAWAPLAALLAVRGAAMLLFREDPLSLLLHPVGVVVVAGLLLDSRRRFRAGRVVWKGRVLPSPRRPAPRRHRWIA